MKRMLWIVVALMALPGLAWAYTEYPTTTGSTVTPAVGMSLNAAGQAVPNSAANPAPIKVGTYVDLGCAPWLSVGTGAAVALSSVSGGIPAGATLVGFVPSGAVNFADGGSTPTGSLGIPVPATAYWPYSGTLTNLRFISQSGTVTVAACFYK